MLKFAMRSLKFAKHSNLLSIVLCALRQDFRFKREPQRQLSDVELLYKSIDDALRNKNWSENTLVEQKASGKFSREFSKLADKSQGGMLICASLVTREF